jgi:hypothetical protein
MPLDAISFLRLNPLITNIDTGETVKCQQIKTKENYVAWVRERTPLVGELSANFCG